MEKLNRLVGVFGGLSVLSMIAFAFESRGVKAKAIKLNTDQLSKGKSNTNERLRTYASRAPQVYHPKTIGYKISVGQPYNKVTLRDTGYFYRSFKILPFHDIAVISTDSKKINTHGQIEHIEDNIDVEGEALGIMPDNMQDLIMSVIPEMQRNLRAELKI